MNKKIDLMIIGAQKAGTSSIIRYLNQHQDICVHETVEFNYFLRDDVFEKGFDNALKQYFDTKKLIERTYTAAKNVGVMYEVEALKRLHTHNPDVKLSIFLRNPVDRAYSAYLYARRKGWETVDFEKAIWANDSTRFGDNPHMLRNCRYKEYGEYGKYIAAIYEIFPKENVKVFIFEEVMDDWNLPVNEMVAMLGLSSIELDTSEKHNTAGEHRIKGIQNLLIPESKVGKIIKNIVPFKLRTAFRKKLYALNEKPTKKEKMSIEIKEELKKYYVPHNQFLEEVLGRDLSIWK